MRIKDAAGWNQTETDWLNVFRLAPQACFGLERDGEIVATTTAVSYGRKLGWIGMVLTDPAHRRQGLGRRLMEHALEALYADGIEWIKLDATDMGAPLYRSLGFEDEAVIERWGVSASEPTSPPAVSSSFSIDAILDMAAFGADRTALLTLLSGIGSASIPGEGYAMARPGSRAAYFGPCVCRSSETAGALLDWFVHRFSRQPLYWDILPANTEAVKLARSRGFEPVRRLIRMVRPGKSGAPPMQHDDSRIFAIAGFEYG